LIPIPFDPKYFDFFLPTKIVDLNSKPLNFLGPKQILAYSYMKDMSMYRIITNFDFVSFAKNTITQQLDIKAFAKPSN
jgi:hypothetical protein